jgi:hypothetical protein
MRVEAVVQTIWGGSCEPPLGLGVRFDSVLGRASKSRFPSGMTTRKAKAKSRFPCTPASKLAGVQGNDRKKTTAS